jgi:hypothetical protein
VHVVNADRLLAFEDLPNETLPRSKRQVEQAAILVTGKGANAERAVSLLQHDSALFCGRDGPLGSLEDIFQERLNFKRTGNRLAGLTERFRFSQAALDLVEKMGIFDGRASIGRQYFQQGLVILIIYAGGGG